MPLFFACEVLHTKKLPYMLSQRISSVECTPVRIEYASGFKSFKYTLVALVGVADIGFLGVSIKPVPPYFVSLGL